MRLPVQAGKVSKMVTTNLVSNSESWIAKGDKYYSLCMPNRHRVACAPIVAASIMQGIDVGAFAGTNGAPSITFHVDPAAKLTPKHIVYTIDYFLKRIDKQVQHFNRMVMIYAPMKGAPTLKAGIDKKLISDGSGGCGYDDFGSYDCSGGDSGTGGGGYDWNDYDWGGDYGGGGGAGNDTSSTSPSLPTFPSGNDNGDDDPCLDENGNNYCQRVVITGNLPDAVEEASLAGCVFTPIGFVCNRTPPVIGNVEPIEQLPRGPKPTFPQSACNIAPIFCAEGQKPVEPPPPLTDWDRKQQAIQQCVERASVNMSTCYALRERLGEGYFDTCRREALDMYKECDMIGKGG
ncbi:hypothetical protein [Massilia sp. TWP1-3-3]|uniref:hypothetical protein n=1 Tax=Massilia sp. TWP1-3-3 TaxID=2804573 RepID=UPI003CFA3ED1